MQNKKKSPFNFNPFKKKETEEVNKSASKKLADITDLLEKREKEVSQIDVEAEEASKKAIEKPKKVEVKPLPTSTPKPKTNPVFIKQEAKEAPKQTSTEVVSSKDKIYLEDEKSVLEQRIKTKQDEIVKFEETLVEENDKLIELDKKINEHKKAYQHYITETEKFSSNINELEEKNNKSEEEIESLVKQTHEKKLELQEAHNRLRNIECELKMNSSLSQNLNAKMAKLQPNIKSLNEKFEELQQEAQDLDFKNTSLDHKIKELQKQKLQLTENNEHLSQQITQLNINNNELETRNKKLETEVRQLDDQFAKQVIEKNTALEEQQRLDHVYDSLDEELRERNTQLSKITNERELIKSDINQKKNKCEFIQQDIQEIKDKNEDEQRNLEQIKTKQSQVHDTLNKLLQNLDVNHETLQKTKNKKVEIEKKIIAYESKIKNANVQINTTEQSLELTNLEIDNHEKQIVISKQNFEETSSKLERVKKEFAEKNKRLRQVAKSELTLTNKEDTLTEKLKKVKVAHKEVLFNIDAKEKSISRLKNRNISIENELKSLQGRHNSMCGQNKTLLTEIKETKADRAFLDLQLREVKELYRKEQHHSDSLYAKINYLKKKQSQLVVKTNRKQKEVDLLLESKQVLTKRRAELEARLKSQEKKDQDLNKQHIQLQEEFNKLKTIATSKAEALAVLIRKNKVIQDKNIDLKNKISDKNLKISALNEKNEFFASKLTNWKKHLEKLKKEEKSQADLYTQKIEKRDSFVSTLEALGTEISQVKLKNKNLNEELFNLSELITAKNKVIIEDTNLVEKLRLQSRTLQENIKVKKVKLEGLTRKSAEYQDEIRMQYDLIRMLRDKVIDLEDKLDIGHEEVANCKSKLEEGNILLNSIEQYGQRLYQKDVKASNI